MRAKLILVGVLLCISAGSARTEDCDCFSDSFDVPGGQVQTLYSDGLTLRRLVKCTFSIDDGYLDPSWLSSLNIVFLPREQPNGGKHLIRLMAFQAEENEGWRYHLEVKNRDSRESRITAYTGQSDSVLPMSMILHDENVVGYFVGEDASNLSLIDVSNLNPISWQVIVSGIRGSVDCGSIQVEQNPSSD